MSAPNKSYDPVEVEALKPEEIERMRDEALAAFAALGLASAARTSAAPLVFTDRSAYGSQAAQQTGIDFNSAAANGG